MTNFPLDAQVSEAQDMCSQVSALLFGFSKVLTRVLLQTLNDGGRDGTGPAYLRIKAALEKTPDDLDLLSQLIKACLLLKDDKLTEAVFKARLVPYIALTHLPNFLSRTEVRHAIL